MNGLTRVKDIDGDPFKGSPHRRSAWAARIGTAGTFFRVGTPTCEDLGKTLPVESWFEPFDCALYSRVPRISQGVGVEHPQAGIGVILP